MQVMKYAAGLCFLYNQYLEDMYIPITLNIIPINTGNRR